MSNPNLLDHTRRSFLAAGAFTIMRPDQVRGAGKEKLKAGLVGCGGRGTQAVTDMLTGNENVELVAMADVFEDKLEGSLRRLRDPQVLKRYAGIVVPRGGEQKEMKMEDLVASVQPRIKVEPEKHFVGFDAFQKLIASDVDIVMLCTPPGYRPQHFEAAIKAGKHVFTEKPVATDPVGCRKFMAAAKTATEKKLTVVSGAQRHAQKNYVETVDKIRNGPSARSKAAIHTTCRARYSTRRAATRSGATWSGSTATGIRSSGSAGTRLWSSTSTTSISFAG